MMNINWLLDNGPCKSFKAGTNISDTAAGADKAMYILLSGSIDVFSKIPSGAAEKVSTVAPGDVFFGREFFFGQGTNEYRVTEDATVYVLTKETFDDLSWSQPDILFEVLRSAYMMPSAPVSTTAPAPQKAQAKSTPKPATKEQIAVTGEFILPGHKIYDAYFPMNTKLVYPKEYTCPVCKKKFTDFRIFNSKLVEIAPMRYDFRKTYADFIIEWYEILTCSHCLFSSFHTYFTDPKPIKIAAIENKLIAARADIPIDFNTIRDINHVFKMHYLALICCDGFPTIGKQLYAKILGNLSWLYEDVEDKEMQILAASKAAEAFEAVHLAGNLTPTQDQMTCLSIAAMQHRAGIDNNLKKYLYSAKTNRMGDPAIATLAGEFWTQLGLGDYTPDEDV